MRSAGVVFGHYPTINLILETAFANNAAAGSAASRRMRADERTNLDERRTAAELQ